MATPDAKGLRVLLTGAAGLVGQGVALACQTSPRVTRLAALVRSAGSLQGAGEEIVLPDFLDAGQHRVALEGFDACFYCAGAPPLGTPEAKYRQVTFDTTMAVARAWAEANPHGRFLYISGAGADPGSRMMPLRIKGETEGALALLPIRTVMLRPGGVRPVASTGTRHAAVKPLYWGGSPLMRLAEAVAPSLVTSNLSVGQAMLALAAMAEPPAVVDCGEINRLAERVEGGG
ncbi:oxidoreductase [Stenotrophomonas sp. HITSZ_GD]|uniref:SDR family oxidoreductase n=1 Tax=Stenotrophomonas sp. HITSZ_GD TaxID=3037248 RepID=UPI00240E5541|nr:oxidoreductase [Stenotrophomonas sp. HITSZ_GD]MDG2524191.1 oxidoreductase [Stenotrophomonas sp. HITSZ_GD]